MISASQMVDSCSNFAMLAVECHRVIGLRSWKLAWGGSAAAHEAHHMIAEKMNASREATGRLMAGASMDSIVTDYRLTVQANIRRLSA